MALLRHLQLLRANTADLTSHIGYPGELIVNTDTWTLTLHDGVTPGGYIASANLVAINAEIAALEANIANISSNSLINGSNVVSLDAYGGLNLANVGLIRAPNNGAGPINLASDTFVQMQWSANSNAIDPNSEWTGSTTWVYVDNGGFHVEAITPGHDAYWNFDTAGNFTFPDSTIQTTAFSNVALANYLAGTVTIGNLTVQGNITTVNSEIVQHNEIVAGNITSNSFVTAQYFQGNGALLTGLPIGYSNVQLAGYLGANYYITSNTANLSLYAWSANITAANVGMKGYVDAVTTAWTANANIQQALIGNLQASAYSNVNVAAYLSSQGIGGGNYSNVNVAAYLTTNSYLTSNLANLANYAWSANVTSANVGVVGYINQQVTAANTAANAANIGMLGYINSQTFYSNTRVATYLQVGNIANISVAGNVTATYFVGNGALLTGIAASSNYSNVQVATYLPTYSGNIANITLSPSGVLTFADGTTQTTASGSSYSNVNVTTFLSNSSAIFVGNTGNVSSVYPLQSNITQFFVGNQTTLTSGAGLSTTTTYLMNNLYFLANGAAYYRNTQSGAAWITIAGSGINFAGTSGAVTANTAQGMGSWASLNSTAFATQNAVGITSAGTLAVNGAGGMTTTQTTFPLINTTATTINFGGAATAINMGAAAVAVSVGSGAGNVTAGNFIGSGQFLTSLPGYAYSNVNVAAYIATFGSGGSGYGNANVASYLPTYTGNVGVNSILGTSPNVTLVSNSYSTTYDITGNVAFGNTAYPVQITAFGNISTGGYLFGNGAFLTGIVASSGGSNYSNANVAAYLVGYTGNVGATNLNANYVYATNYVSTGAVYSPVIGNTGAYITGANVNIAGNVNATYFVGNGRFLTGIITGSGSNYGNSNVAAYLPTYFGNIGNVTLGASSIAFPYGTQFFEVNNLDSEILVPYQFTINTNGGGVQYTFGNGGYLGLPAGLVFPDTTQQTTAFSNAAVQTYLSSVNPVQLGSGAGASSQGTDAVAIGRSAGAQQGIEAVAIGVIAGQTNQNNWAVAIGSSAGTTNQGQRAVAIGVQSAESSQGAGAVAIGAYAGDNTQGQYAVAIGTHAGDSNQPQNSIILNASGSPLNGTNSGLYINPVRNDLANVANVVYYNAVTNELTYAPAPSGGGGSYGNANVASYLISSNATFIGNTGNVSSVYSLQSNITQLFIGNQTSLSSGNSSVTTNTWLLNNLFFNSAGNLSVRNTQAGYNYIQMGTNGIMLGGYLGASTANTVASIFTPWMTVNGTTGLVLTGGLTAGAAVAVNSASGITTNQATFPLVNATATTVNFGGAATTITMGATGGTANVFFGGNAILQTPNAALGTNLYPLVLRPAGQYNYLLLYGIAGGYNSPPYNNQALTGGSGSGMTASYSSTGGYVGQSSLVVTNPGTGYKNGDILTLPGGLGTTVLLFNYNAAKTSNTAAASYTFGFDGNLTLPGNIIFPSSSYIYGDFSNATVNSRTVFVTSGNSATTGIYATPSGTATAASWQAANSANLTAASKILIATNGTTDVQLVSGINGSGTYLPLSFYNNGAAQMQLTVSGNLNMTVNNSITTSGTGFHIGNIAFPDGTTQTTAAVNNNFGNVNVAAYLNTQGYNLYSNVNVAAYLSTFSGNIANIRLGPSGVLTFADGTTMTTAATGGGGSSYSNVNVAAYLATASITTTGNLTAPYFNGNVVGTQYGNSVGATATYTGNVTAANFVGNTYGNSYGNVSGTVATFTGNVTAGIFVGNVVATTISNPVTNSNTTITAGSYTTTFDTLGNVTAQGNIVANYLFGNGFFLTGVVTSGGGGSNYGNTNVIAYLAGNITTGNITTIGNVNASYFVGTQVGNSVGTTATFTGNVTGNYFVGNLTNPTGNVYTVGNIIVGVAGYTVLPTTVAQLTGNANTYSQFNIQNISSGTASTSEIVATANNGTDNIFYVDLGIAGNTYNVNAPANSLGTTIYPNDAYLYAQGNVSTQVGGNLAIGTSTLGKTVKLFAGGINAANVIATVSATGVAVTGDVTATGNVTAAGNVTATGNITSSGYIVTTGGYGNISQVNTITANNVVATANVTVQGIGVTMPNRPAFRVSGTGGPTQTTSNVNLKSPQTLVAFNQGGYYNDTTGQFVAPVAGLYNVGLNARVTTTGTSQIAVLKNGLNSSGNVICFWETAGNSGTATHFGVNGTVQLAVGDYLSANILMGSVNFDGNDNWHVTYLG